MSRAPAPRGSWLGRMVRSLIKDAILLAVVGGVIVWLLSRTHWGAALLSATWHAAWNRVTAHHEPRHRGPAAGPTTYQGRVTFGGPAATAGAPVLMGTNLVPRGLTLGMTYDAYMAGAGKAWYREGTDAGSFTFCYPSPKRRPDEPYLVFGPRRTIAQLTFSLDRPGVGRYDEEGPQRQALAELARYCPDLRPAAMRRVLVRTYEGGRSGREQALWIQDDAHRFAWFRGTRWTTEVHLLDQERMRGMAGGEGTEVRRQLNRVEAIWH